MANNTGVLSFLQKEDFSAFYHKRKIGKSQQQLLKKLLSGALVILDTSDPEMADLEMQNLERMFKLRFDLIRDCLKASEVTGLLGVSRQTPHDRIKSKSLLAIKDNGKFFFPRWQFDAEGPDGVIEGLPDVLQELKISDLAKAKWLSTPDAVLDNKTPISVLKEGGDGILRVIKEARSIGGTAL
ncbi:MAG: hypothetical protein H6618_06985 [Deltaproteobacteria bacterium]|nr:hypothetical protein [Deltaproteobacteria bacterium]